MCGLGVACFFLFFFLCFFFFVFFWRGGGGLVSSIFDLPIPFIFFFVHFFLPLPVRRLDMRRKFSKSRNTYQPFRGINSKITKSNRIFGILLNFNIVLPGNELKRCIFCLIV